MKININNTEYDLDVEKAKALGVLVSPKIIDFKVGDVFHGRNTSSLLILRTAWGKDTFLLAGYDGVEPYSSMQTTTKSQILKYLNDNKCYFVRNINKEVNELINKK